jgi:hypothetical protein
VHLSVFVPEQNALGVSEYQIFSAAPAASRMIATVRVWQGATAGQWVRLGSYLISGAFEIRLMPTWARLLNQAPVPMGGTTWRRRRAITQPSQRRRQARPAAKATSSG